MKRKNTPTPHDAVFKQFLSYIDTARDFLEIHLPATLRAFRLMRYGISAMQRHLEQGHEKLPLVIPVLFYHGKIQPYPWSTNWLNCFDAPALAEEIYSNKFPLVDVTVIPDDEILTHKRVALLEMVQKHIRQRDMAELLQELVILLTYDYYTDEQLKSVLNYLLQVGDTADPEGFIRRLAEQSLRYEEVLMTIAQRLEHKARQEGRQEATLKIAHALLNSGIDRETVMKTTGLSQSELE
ncbi:Rpn family recombination-promoting nuclease/putative transposase [Photorhabdus bodei]|uniref:Rpn family recombination-promoting nuclease/putative transposase n=1 Tax=Photorhabdus bodei TaxID=2029681 RepID=A0AAW6BHX5_9GAMM|nr:Rpn family recombination-promoting nuclease/putative transposase [Photorhabdus bodei]MDB6371572.1 Rpn family recombination-promoting nuclease/putative transposase [Photorhabdus bodei]